MRWDTTCTNQGATQMIIEHPTPERGRRPAHWLAAVGMTFALVLGSCSSDDGDAGDAATNGDVTAGAGEGAEGAADAPRCEQGATVDQVEVEPVDDVESDFTLTSFDGTEIRLHWFPAEDASADDPAPALLMGPGWSLPGASDPDGDPILGGIRIREINEHGYHVLTWDPRGFGVSSGTAQINHPDTEGRDVQLLIDWLAEQPEVVIDAEGDPRVGMIGGSYGGGIQLTVASIDCRVDALVPTVAWHSLESSLFKAETMKTGWAGLLVNIGEAGSIAPQIMEAYESGSTTGVVPDETMDWFTERGPGDRVGDVRTPTLFVHGTVDTLFTLDEAATNFAILEDNDVATSMLWFCGGHGACRTDGAEEDWVVERTLAWLDHHLLDSDVDTGSVFEFIDQKGVRWRSETYPPTQDGAMSASGSGELQLSDTGGAVLDGDLGSDGLVASLVGDITPGPADNAVEVTVEADGDSMVVGAPKLTITYRGTSPDGELPTRVFAQLVDDELGVVVGNQITPIEVTLDGETHTTEVDMEIVAQHLAHGESVTLQLVAYSGAYLVPRLGGEITFESVEVSLPVVADIFTP